MTPIHPSQSRKFSIGLWCWVHVDRTDDGRFRLLVDGYPWSGRYGGGYTAVFDTPREAWDEWDRIGTP